MSYFVYRELTPDKRRIRLIHLLPKHTLAPSTSSLSDTLSKAGTSDPEIRVSCTVSHVSLDQPPDYVALSYTWGDASQKVRILVNEAHFYVTKNLEVALAHLTPEDKPLVLWIDALCIDQDDEVEKTEQVQQMQQIYLSATSVITWLGPAAEGSDAAMHWIQHYGTIAKELGIGTKPELHLRRLLQNLESDPGKLPHERFRVFLCDISAQLSETDGGDNVGKALSSLFKRDYWSRIWVVQELVHANHVQFVCGNMTVLEEPLHYALRLLRNFGQYQLSKLAQHPQLTNSGSSSAAFDTRNPVNVLKIRRTSKSYPLVYSIRTLRYFHATDPRDKIFALLSFAEDAAALGLRPNYSKSYEDVYLETTILLLRHGFWDILSLCETHEVNVNAPSWVPDYSRVSYRSPLQQRAVKRGNSPVSTVLQPEFSASGRTPKPRSFCDVTQTSPRTLLLHATLVDEVKNVGTVWEPRAFQRWLQEIMRFSRPGSTALDPDHLRAVWRTAVADQEIRQGNQKPRMSEHGLEKVHSALKNIDVGVTDASTLVSLGLEHYLYQLQDVAYRRRPFRTSKGHFGIGPCNMSPGDILYILIGVDVPYIFRPAIHNRMQLVGEAYVHGIMDGELFDSEPPIDLVNIC